MKKLILFIFCLLSIASGSVYAQVYVHSFEEDEFANLKNRTTLFVANMYSKEDLEKVISEVWTFNKFKILSRDEYKTFILTEEYAIFILGGSSSTLTTSAMGFSAGGGGFGFNNGGVGSSSTFRRDFYLYSYPYKKKKKKKLRDIAKIYIAFNYGLGYLKNQLTVINEKLSKNEKLGFYGNRENLEKLKELKHKTLFVPFEIKKKLHPVRLKLIDRKSKKLDGLFKDYEHEYQYISREDLQEKILTATESFYYLMSTNAAKEKFVEVIDGYTGEVIYHDYNANSYDLVAKNVKHLNSKIE